MKYFFCLTIVFLSSYHSFSQVEFRAGMGIDFLSTPSLTDYYNRIAGFSDELGTFNSAIIFSAEGGYYLAENYFISLEAAYLFNSFTFSDILGKYELSYGIIMPSLMNYYVVQGKGYNFKFGGGIGPRLVNLTEKLRGTAASESFTSTGFGIILRADGNTLLSGNVYANIGADIKYNLNGEPKSSDRYLTNQTDGEKVNLNAFSIGVKLGVTFLF